MIRFPGMRSRSLGAFADEEIDPCVPGKEPGYDFDQNRKRCFDTGQCIDYDQLPTPGDRWVPVAYKNEPRLCMKQSDLNAGKKPCDVYADYPLCKGDSGGISTGEKVALGVAAVALLSLGYVAFGKDWSKEK